MSQTLRQAPIVDVRTTHATRLTASAAVTGVASEASRISRVSRNEHTRHAKVLIVDDEELNGVMVRRHLKAAGYEQCLVLEDSVKALPMIREEKPDLVILDVMMPQVSGLDILQVMNLEPELQSIPVLMMTSMTEAEIKYTALELGATDFLSKPVDPNELIPRVRNTLTSKLSQDRLKGSAAELDRQVRERTAELVKSREEVVHCLARACEFRDSNTGSHIIRVGKFAGIIALELGYSDAQVESLELAAQLHDIGKIGIPDAILHKPGKLDPEEYALIHKHCGFGKQIIGCLPSAEWAVLKQHTEHGARMLDTKASPVLALAARIALTHHEWWNGEGYPLGLSGTDIPIEGRITAVADVYDALSSKRTYKSAFSREKCFALLDEGRDRQFDPTVLDAFFRRGDHIVETQIRYADQS